MRKRRLGNTGIEISELSLGTWGLSGEGYGEVAEEHQETVLRRAAALGITAIDTADSYAEGTMESRIGRHAQLHPELTLITKLGTDRSETPPVKRFDPAYVERALGRSTERLGRRPDIVLLHNPSLRAFEHVATLDFLRQCKTRGEIKAWGVSVGDVAVGQAAIDHGAEVLEIAYNVFHSRDLNQLREQIEGRGIGVLSRSVLAHGLLCGLWPTTKEFGRGDHRADRWTPDELRRRISQLSALRPAVYGEVTSLRSAALRFALADELVSSVVIGPRSALQLDQLVRDAGKEPPYLTIDAKSSLEARLSNVGIYS